jgi:hypothetical protein
MPMTITGGATNNLAHSANTIHLYNTRVAVADPSLMSAGAVIQTVTKRIDTYSAWTAPVGTNTIVTDFDMIITPKYSTSRVLITYMISFEMHQDTVFRLGRNNVEIVRNNTDANRWSGWVNPGYDQDTASTPRTNYYVWIDSPATTAAVTYNLMVSSSDGNARTLFVNRNANGNGSDANEIGISYVMLQEIA